MGRSGAGVGVRRDDHVGTDGGEGGPLPEGPVEHRLAGRGVERPEAHQGGLDEVWLGVVVGDGELPRFRHEADHDPRPGVGRRCRAGGRVVRGAVRRVPEVRDAGQRCCPELVPGADVGRSQRARRVSGLLPQDQGAVAHPGAIGEGQRVAARPCRCRPRHLGRGRDRGGDAGQRGEGVGPRAVRPHGQRDRDGDRDDGDDDRRDRRHPVPTEPAQDAPRVVADDTTGAVDVVDGRGDDVVVLDELDHRHLAARRHATGRYRHVRRRRLIPPGDLTPRMLSARSSARPRG